MKDVKNEEWPILGICQGLEVISLLYGEDNIETLDDIVIYGESRPIEWAIQNVTEESVLFSTFPQELIDAMEVQDIALHAHSYSISVETYENTVGLRENMKITQTDVWTRPSDG